MRAVILMLIMLLSVNQSYAQVKKVFISGSVTVENLDDFSDVSVIFNKTVPDEKEYTVSPEVDGKFNIEIEEGIYDVTFTLEFCEDVLLEDINLFDNKTLDEVTLIFLGEYLYGSIEGVLKSGVYEVRENLLVELNKQLIIEPGTTLKFAKDVSFRVEGELSAKGTDEERIIFTSLNTGRAWNGIYMDAGEVNYGEGCFITLEYVTIEESKRFSISAYYTVFKFDHILYQDNYGGFNINFSGEDCYIKNSVFIRNESDIFAGISLNGANLQIENCVIAFNESTSTSYMYAGGGISCSTGMDSKASFKNCLIYGNKAHLGGGARLAGNVKLINCVIANNIATAEGSGLYFTPSYAEVINCVIANNHTFDENDLLIPGYQIAASKKHDYKLRNSILYHVDGMYWDTSTAPVGFGGFLRTNFNRDSTDAYGNMFSDPRFEDIDANLFKLLPGSQAIDAGLNIDKLPAGDYFNLVRLWDGNNDNISIVDIGIHEFGAPEIQKIYKVEETGFESETDFVRYDSDSYQRTEEESRSGVYALLLLNSDDDSEKWITSEKFKTASDEKYYLSFWVKISGMPLEEDDALRISFSAQGADIASEEYIIHTLKTIDRLWQKVMIELSVQPSDEAIFALSAMINSGTKLYIDDIMIEKESELSSIKAPDKLIQIKLFPNPAIDYLEISFPEEILCQTNTFEIFNSNGLMLKNIKTGTKTINITDLPCGMYFLRISYNGNAFYRKFAVVR